MHDGQSLQAVILCDKCGQITQLTVQDACYTLGVLKPCYSVERELSDSSTASTRSTKPQATSIHTSLKLEIHFYIVHMKEQ